MSILRIGNAAFRRLSTVFDLPGTIHLRDVDISAAYPQIDLKNLIAEELVEPWTFQREITRVDAGTSSARVSPYVAGDWTAIFRGNLEVSSVPTGQQVLIINAGVQTDSLVDVTIHEQPSQGAAVTVVPVQVLFAGDSVIGFNRVVRANGPTFVQRLPWDTIWTHHIRWESAAAGTLLYTATALVGPRGILPRSGFEL